MPFSQRNICYLRTSPHVVLQTILYLDPRDLRWMNSHPHSDEDVLPNEGDGVDEQSTGSLVWARALSELRNKIMPKLRAESIQGEYLSSTNKKEKVDVHIEPDFQMAYFFRKASGKHAVLLKEKELRFPAAATATEVSAPPTDMPPPLLPASVMQSRGGFGDAMPPSRLAARESNQLDNILAQGSRIANDLNAQPLRAEQDDVKPAKRKRASDMIDNSQATGLLGGPIRIKEEDDEHVMALDDLPIEPLQQPSTDDDAVDVDSLVEDKKPRLHVKYSGFKIFGKCLIIVIEPTKRTKRLRPNLFLTKVPMERHQLSATPVPRQTRETPIPASARATPVDVRDDAGRSDSRRDRLADGLFRSSSSDWTPTPTPEPELARRNDQTASTAARAHDTGILTVSYDEDGESGESHSVLLATQMLEGGIGGQGNDIDGD